MKFQFFFPKITIFSKNHNSAADFLTMFLYSSKVADFCPLKHIKKSRKSYGDNESEYSMKNPGNCTILKSNNEEIPKMNRVQSSSSDIDQSNFNSVHITY